MKIFTNNGSRVQPLVGVSVEGEECPACSKLSIYVDHEVQWHNARCGLKNQDKLKRIHIVGGPGSGKTTLAHEIGTRLGIEVYELDLIAFTGPDYIQRTLSERLADISLIANRPAWITEGLFILWTEPLLEYADIIVWLDNVTWGRSMWRTVHRFVSLALKEAKSRRGTEKLTRFNDYARHLRQLIHVFSSSRVYYAAPPSSQTSQIESRTNTAQRLAFYKDKVIHCYTDEAIKAFLNYVHVCSS
jgi:adenylate kinase family enzyme/ribosomal protein S27AE